MKGLPAALKPMMALEPHSIRPHLYVKIAYVDIPSEAIIAWNVFS